MSVETRGTQGCRVRSGRRVHHGTFFDQQLDYVQVSGSGRTPQRWRSLYGFTVKINCKQNTLFYRSEIIIVSKTYGVLRKRKTKNNVGNIITYLPSIFFSKKKMFHCVFETQDNSHNGARR